LTRARETSQRLEHIRRSLKTNSSKRWPDPIATRKCSEPAREKCSAVPKRTSRRSTRNSGDIRRASRQAVAQFDRQIAEMVQPHSHAPKRRFTGWQGAVAAGCGADAAAGPHPQLRGRSLRGITGALPGESGQRGANSAGSSQSITWRNLTELEGKAGDLKHQMSKSFSNQRNGTKRRRRRRFRI